MSDLRRAAQALARETSEVEPGKRSADSVVPLPDNDRHEWEASATHRIRLYSDDLDLQRLESALKRVVFACDALRTRVERRSGREVLVVTDEPHLERVDACDELVQASPTAPLRWCGSADGESVELSVSAFVFSTASWGNFLGLLAKAYAGADLEPQSTSYLDLAYAEATRRPTGERGDRRPCTATPEPLISFAEREARTTVTVASRDDSAVDANQVIRRVTDAVVALGWRASTVRMQVSSPRVDAPDIVGHVTDSCFRDVSIDDTDDAGNMALVAGLGDTLADEWTRFPETFMQVSVDVIDLPELDFGGHRMVVQPIVPKTAAIDVVVVRSQAGSEVVVAAGEPVAEAIAEAIASPSTRVREDQDQPEAGAESGSDEPEIGELRATDLRVARLVTEDREVDADAVEKATERRRQELGAAGASSTCPVLIDAVDATQIVPNLLAAWRCGADVLVIDGADPREWNEGLRDALPAVVRVDASNRVEPAKVSDQDAPPTAPSTDPSDVGDPALLLGLSSCPGEVVIARVGADDLLASARLMAELTRRDDANWLGDIASGADQFAIAVAAAHLAGSDLLVAEGNRDRLVDRLLDSSSHVVLDRDLLAHWEVPVRDDSGWIRLTRSAPADAADPEPAADAEVRRWSVAECPRSIWDVVDTGLLRSHGGKSRVVTTSGRAVATGGVGFLAVLASPESCYVGDPRRTAHSFRPCPAGQRELWTDIVVGVVSADTLRVLDRGTQRVVAAGRTCFTDALRQAGEVGWIDLQTEAATVVTTEPTTFGSLPIPLAVSESFLDADGNRPRWALRAEAQSRGSRSLDTDWRNGTEEFLAATVADVLGFEAGREDNLFGLGATSLGLMQLLLRVRESRRVEIPVARFFGEPTIAALAELVDRESPGAAAEASEVLDEITRESE